MPEQVTSRYCRDAASPNRHCISPFCCSDEAVIGDNKVIFMKNGNSDRVRDCEFMKSINELGKLHTKRQNLRIVDRLKEFLKLGK